MPILTDVSIRTFKGDVRFRTTMPYRSVVLKVLSVGRDLVDGSACDDSMARDLYAEIPHYLDFEVDENWDNPDGFHVCVNLKGNEVFLGANFDKDSWGNTGFGGTTDHIHWEGSTGADWLELVN